MIKKPLNNLTGIVLNISPYGEDSAIVVLGTTNGLLNFVSKHLYKMKNAIKPLSNIGTLVNIDFQPIDETMNIATSANTILDVTSLYSSLASSSFLFFLAQLSVLLFSEGDYYPLNDVEYLLNSLKNDADPLSVSLLLIGSFYKSLGLVQNVNSCVRCKRTQNIVTFDLKSGGFICADCLDNQSMVKDKEELYVFKFVFSEINSINVNRKVPRYSGMKLLKELTQYLLEYYDLKKCESLELFMNSLL